MMIVDSEKCIGCGKCVKDCFPDIITLVEGKAKIKNLLCIKCGHCIAICPTDAITTDEYDMGEVKEYKQEEFEIESEKLLNFIKFRRSVRQFQDKDVEDEKILKIIEAGRFTQTASNKQELSYIVVRKGIDEIKKLVFATLKDMSDEIIENLTPETKKLRAYAYLWDRMYKEYKENPRNDKLFFNAPALIIVTANTQVDGSLASSNMELMTNALGLGTFFSGFFVRASQKNKDIRELIEVDEGKEVVTCMVIGYPGVKYLRTVPRKSAEIKFI